MINVTNSKCRTYDVPLDGSARGARKRFSALKTEFMEGGGSEPHKFTAEFRVEEKGENPLKSNLKKSLNETIVEKNDGLLEVEL